MESVIDCPICYDTDACFEDTQEKFKSYMCFNCGFMSSTYYTKDNSDMAEGSSKLVDDLKFFDKERKIYWYPSVLNMGPKGVIFPEGTPEDYVWRYAKVIEILEEERDQYNNYDRRLDVDNAETYSRYEFMKACEAMGITKETK